MVSLVHGETSWSALSPTYWEDRREEIGEALRNELVLASAGELDDIWERTPEVREDMRPMLADWGEVAQFLHTKRLVLAEPFRGTYFWITCMGILQRR